MELYNIYRPITATPFKNNEYYMEFAPCDALKPYIRCFWGTRRAVKQEKSDVVVKEIVTPDTCMDIIFTVDFTNNKIKSTFHEIDDRTFAIRFYAWGVIAFTEESMRDTRNAFFDVGYHFSKIKKEIENQLFDVADMYQLVSVVEKVLLKRLSDRYKKHTVLQAMRSSFTIDAPRTMPKLLLINASYNDEKRFINILVGTGKQGNRRKEMILCPKYFHRSTI